MFDSRRRMGSSSSACVSVPERVLRAGGRVDSSGTVLETSGPGGLLLNQPQAVPVQANRPLFKAERLMRDPAD